MTPTKGSLGFYLEGRQFGLGSAQKLLFCDCWPGYRLADSYIFLKYR